MNLTFESIDNPEKSASDYDYADWVQFAEGYEKAHVRELQYDCYFVQDYIGNKLSDFCYINDTGLSGSDYFGKIEYELANFGEKYAEVPIESKNDLYNYTVVYQDPMPDFSVKHGSTDKLTVRLGVIYSGNINDMTSLGYTQGAAVSEITTIQPEDKISFVIVDDEIGEYGESVTINKGTEFEETEIMYHVPAGKYSITNTDKKTGVQVSIYSGRPMLVGEWEEFVADANCQSPVVLMAGETKDIEIMEGQFIVLSDNSGAVRFDMK